MLWLTSGTQSLGQILDAWFSHERVGRKQHVAVDVLAIGRALAGHLRGQKNRLPHRVVCGEKDNRQVIKIKGADDPKLALADALGRSDHATLDLNPATVRNDILALFRARDQLAT